MRIINSVLGDARGGRWQVVCDYSRLLRKQGHDVVMVLNDKLPEDLPGLPADTEILRIRNHGHYDWLAAWRLSRRLAGCQPALAIAHCSRSVALLKRVLGGVAPVIAVTHSTKVRRLLGADAVIALSDALREKIRADPSGQQMPVYVVPNQIGDLPEGCPQSQPLQQPPVIGALGRFDRVKGFDIFIDALAVLAEQGVVFSGRLAGAGEEEAQLREQIRLSGLAGRIDLKGWIAAEKVNRFLAGLDLLCIPARSDAFGLTPLQGAAAGVPMVLSDVSGHRAIFAEDREALFFKTEDATALASRIRQFLSDSGLREALSAAAFDRAERCYSESAVIQGLREVITNTLLLNNKE
ncbi:glycosyltransferase involved in cell wall biosynthesis [Thiogranum longum]|uniref:Glycosyltransferase involved in cell wall biosynthesis n=1 Tax=Thiogranum longum TaxID=1537524 RepID=A0A4R1H6W7_9GAMM|nr:glycosyltransferase family 4 protein [Thiogranum longum]TCK16908.1 glycosyltransferase involved in cell wall biosynthesis [Thiogranum longum]